MYYSDAHIVANITPDCPIVQVMFHLEDLKRIGSENKRPLYQSPKKNGYVTCLGTQRLAILLQRKNENARSRIIAGWNGSKTTAQNING